MLLDFHIKLGAGMFWKVKKRAEVTPEVEAERCLLCEEPPCTRVCRRKNDPGAFMRDVRAGLGVSALVHMERCNGCRACERVCRHEVPLRIAETKKRLAAERKRSATADIC
jgi:Fe-S-cluster-containing dehydrogenase component